MIQVKYNGVDISGSVSINQCFHDMYAADKADVLHFRVNDVAHLWDSWAPASGDEIEVSFGSISTGIMFVTSARPRNGTYLIVAQSAPGSGFEPQFKAWQQVRLLQIGEEIAQRNGLSFSSYGVEDRLYSYIEQAGTGDFRFLAHRARLEGCAILIFNKELVMYSESYMETQEPSKTLTIHEDGDYEYSDNRYALYGSCIVESGVYSGEFAVENGSGRILQPNGLGNIGSDDEAQRFARNMLRYVNKGCYGGCFYSSILSGYAPASVINLSNERAPSWNGPVFLDHVRNDYVSGRSKIFFRKPLEGY